MISHFGGIFFWFLTPFFCFFFNCPDSFCSQRIWILGGRQQSLVYWPTSDWYKKGGVKVSHAYLLNTLHCKTYIPDPPHRVTEDTFWISRYPRPKLMNGEDSTHSWSPHFLSLENSWFKEMKFQDSALVANSKEIAAGALGNLAFNNDNKALIARAGAIEPLIAVLRGHRGAGRRFRGLQSIGELSNIFTEQFSKKSDRSKVYRPCSVLMYVYICIYILPIFPVFVMPWVSLTNCLFPARIGTPAQGGTYLSVSQVGIGLGRGRTFFFGNIRPNSRRCVVFILNDLQWSLKFLSYYNIKFSIVSKKRYVWYFDFVSSQRLHKSHRGPKEIHPSKMISTFIKWNLIASILSDRIYDFGPC